MSPPSQYRTSPFGFLVVSVLFGIYWGFVIVDVYAGRRGYYALGPRYISSMITAMTWGGAAGFAIGLVPDLIVKDRVRRLSFLVRMWIAFGSLFVFYSLFEPAFRNARE